MRLLLVLALTSACAAAESETLVFQGDYVWTDSAEGPLEVVFVSSDSDSWNVEFNFEYLGSPQTFTGTAHGDLNDGPLEGKVNSDNPELGYVFRGEVRDGAFEGTHAELVAGVEKPGGTLQFAR